MEFNIEVRKKQLGSLKHLISSSKHRVQSVLHFLGWTAESVREEEKSSAVCPINVGHKISPKIWNTHIEKCILKAEGYDSASNFLSEPPADERHAIYLDHNKKREIITKELQERSDMRRAIFTMFCPSAWNGIDPDPRTSDRLLSTFAPDERLAFYNYSVANTSGPVPPPEFTTIDKKVVDEEGHSLEQLRALERDSKRRRAKYKSVHLNKKNHTEVLREVIGGQMEEYTEWVLSTRPPSPKIPKIKTEDCIRNRLLERDSKDRFLLADEEQRPHSSISRHSTISDHSSSRYRDRSRDRYSDSKKSSRNRRNNDHRYSDGKYSDRKYSDRKYSDREYHSERRRRGRSPNGRSRDRRRSSSSRDRSFDRRCRSSSKYENGDRSRR